MRSHSDTSSIPQQLGGRFGGAVRSIVPQAPPTWDTIVLAVAVALLPLFYLTLKNWTEASLVVVSVVSVYGIVRNRVPLVRLFPDKGTAWIFASLAFPIIAVFFSIVIRGDLKWSLFQQNVDLLNGPGRLFLAGLALLWIKFDWYCLNSRFVSLFSIEEMLL